MIFFSPLSSSTLSLLIIVLHNIVIIIIYAASCIVSICFFCSLLSRACWHKRRFFEREFSSGFSPQNPGSSKIPTVVFLQLVVQLYSSPMQQPASLFAGTHLVTPFLQRLLVQRFTTPHLKPLISLPQLQHHLFWQSLPLMCLSTPGFCGLAPIFAATL